MTRLMNVFNVHLFISGLEHLVAHSEWYLVPFSEATQICSVEPVAPELTSNVNKGASTHKYVDLFCAIIFINSTV